MRRVQRDLEEIARERNKNDGMPAESGGVSRTGRAELPAGVCVGCVSCMDLIEACWQC